MNKIAMGQRTGKYRTDPIYSKNKKKVFNRYLQDMGSKLTLQEAMANVHKEEPVYKYSWKPKVMSLEEAKEYILSAVQRGISIGYKLQPDGSKIYSIFSRVEEKAVSIEEAKAFKILVKKDEDLLDTLSDICKKYQA